MKRLYSAVLMGSGDIIYHSLEDTLVTKREMELILEKQRAFYRSGRTIPVKFRMEQLRRLYHGIRKYEKDICCALEKDLGKSAYEAYLCEIGICLSELSWLMRHLKAFVRRKRRPCALAQLPGRCYTQAVPYGNVLIMSPWNYPLLLALEPLADALAAGNTAILKPSAYSPATSAVIARLIGELFEPEYVAVVTGGREENTALLEGKFDMVFFTGSQTVGKEVLRHCAEHLTPAVLELGGKSPCIIDETADIDLAARRIVFGKFLNCGQTCVAPDHILCHSDIKERLLTKIGEEITKQFGENPLENPNYGKIISPKHYDRLCALIEDSKVVLGGQRDPAALRIAPTVMDGVSREDPVMGEEIFGPILPILTFHSFDAVLQEQKEKDKPLALYLFSRDRGRIRQVTEELSYGGGCINDVVLHLASSDLAFGGVGESGMGSYHGQAGLEAFSHKKSLLRRNSSLDLPMRYQPYKTPLYTKLLRLFLR